MVTRRSSIRLSPDENDSLKRLYISLGIPSDQYARRPEDLERFIHRWNAISERCDTAEDVMHYIKTKRKKGLWLALGGKHERCPARGAQPLTADQWAQLEVVYSEICVARGLGSDNLDYDDELAKEFSREFALRTGLIRTGRDLLSLIMERRKRRAWRKLDPNRPDDGIGFGDIDEIAS